MREVFKFSLQFVIPNGCNVPYEKIKDCVIFYKEDLESPNEDLVKVEWDLWKLKWHHSTGRSKTAIDGLVSCSQSQFPNIYILLQILAVLPVFHASVERSCSTLRLLKTYLRNTIGDERLIGLALLYINRNIEIKIEDVISDFIKFNNLGRMVLVIHINSSHFFLGI